MNLVTLWGSIKNKFEFSDHSFTHFAVASWQDSISRGQKSWFYYFLKLPISFREEEAAYILICRRVWNTISATSTLRAIFSRQNKSHNQLVWRSRKNGKFICGVLRSCKVRVRRRQLSFVSSPEHRIATRLCKIHLTLCECWVPFQCQNIWHSLVPLSWDTSDATD